MARLGKEARIHLAAAYQALGQTTLATETLVHAQELASGDQKHLAQIKAALGAIYTLAYDVLTDFEPVAMIATNPQIIVAKKAVPARDLQGLIAWLKANSSTATQGTAGYGSGSHLSGIYFQNITGAPE